MQIPLAPVRAISAHRNLDDDTRKSVDSRPDAANVSQAQRSVTKRSRQQPQSILPQDTPSLICCSLSSLSLSLSLSLYRTRQLARESVSSSRAQNVVPSFVCRAFPASISSSTFLSADIAAGALLATHVGSRCSSSRYTNTRLPHHLLCLLAVVNASQSC